MNISTNLIKKTFSTRFPSYLLNQPNQKPKSTFFAKDLIQTNRQELKSIHPLDPAPIFGSISTDYMVTIDHSDLNGWSNPKITPFQDIEVHPFSSALNYAVQCYEGLKAYRSPNDEILLFRPQLNYNRFRNSCLRLCLPDFSTTEFSQIVNKLLLLEKKWVPSFPNSLYIRPFAYATNQSLGVRRPDRSCIQIVLSPVGPYYSSGFQSISLSCEDKFIRCSPGGSGNYKLGSNYGPTIQLQKMAENKGFNQVLWLWEGQIQEVGTSNVFFIWKDGSKKKIVTPKADDLVLHGVTRDSVISLVKEKGIEIDERNTHIDEVIRGLESGNLLEIFCSGTAVTISSVNKLEFKGKIYPLNINKQLGAGELAYELYHDILDIQYGKKQHPWSYIVK